MIRTWLLKILFWDGALPLVTATAPMAVQALTEDRAAVEFASVLLPVIAFLVRLEVGRRTIGSNNCGSVTRFFQYLLFFVGLVALILVDTFLMLTYIMPAGALFATMVDVTVFSGLVSTYLVGMILAMYPGRAAPAPIPDVRSFAERKATIPKLFASRS